MVKKNGCYLGLETIHPNHSTGATTARIPFSTTKTIRMDMVEDSDEDFYEPSDEYRHVYYSDSISSDEEELKYNPWAEDEQLEEKLSEDYSPAYFLANSEPRKDQMPNGISKKTYTSDPLITNSK